jgi:hypothetical protein
MLLEVILYCVVLRFVSSLKRNLQALHLWTDPAASPFVPDAIAMHIASPIGAHSFLTAYL